MTFTLTGLLAYGFVEDDELAAVGCGETDREDKMDCEWVSYVLGKLKDGVAEIVDGDGEDGLEKLGAKGLLEPNPVG